MDTYVRLVLLASKQVMKNTKKGIVKIRRISMQVLIITILALGGMMLYLLSKASFNTALFAEDLPVLMGFGLIMVVILLLLVGYQLFRIRRRLRDKVFGAKLTLRLVLLFSLVAVLPGALVYSVSVQFLAGSIESWFDVRVDKALEGGLSLGRINLDAGLSELQRAANTMALNLTEKTTQEQTPMLHQLREELGVYEAALIGADGAIVSFSSSDPASLLPQMLAPSVLSKVRMQQNYAVIEQTGQYSLRLRVAVPLNDAQGTIEVLQVLQPVPDELAKDAAMVEEAYGDYQELSLSRAGLKRLYTLALTVTLGLALLSALFLAVLFSEKLSSPLGFLAAGTKAVAQGDFSKRSPVPGGDELSMLTSFFNSMTQQLAEAKSVVESNQTQLSEAKGYLESVLANLSAGVIAFDSQFKMRSANRSAMQILGANKDHGVEITKNTYNLKDNWLNPVVNAAKESFTKLTFEPWEQQLELETAKGHQVLLLRGSQLSQEKEVGYVIVFDDITHLIRAQRDAAWSEVARRLAHEIKNPLTPIQLSAERLQTGLREKLNSDSQELLNRATATIVNQVSELKGMVNEFSQYARSPAPVFEVLNLSDLIRQVSDLYDHSKLNFTVNNSNQDLFISGDKTKLRQLIHNLLQNAEQAVASVDEPAVNIQTDDLGKTVRVRVTDNGGGFPKELIKKAFEPYVTTKLKGTGLGLAIVKKIVEEHNGKIRIANHQDSGAIIEVTLPTNLKKRLETKKV